MDHAIVVNTQAGINYKNYDLFYLFLIIDFFCYYTNNYSDVYILFEIYNFMNSILIFTSTIHKFSPFKTSAHDIFSNYFSIHGTVDFSIILIEYIKLL